MAQRQLARVGEERSKTFERLSSGLRINGAGDDAAGLAIVSSLQSRSRVYGQAARNVSDGLGMLSVAQGAMQEIGGVLDRLQELSEQSANGVYSNKQREALNSEAQSLVAEVNRIINGTQFNGLGLLNGSLAGGIRLQAGYGEDGSITGYLTAGTVRGDGKFGSITSSSSLSGTQGKTVLLRDIDGGHNDDLVAFGGGLNPGVLSIQLGVGDGTFKSPVSYGSGAPNTGFYGGVLADLNGDGALDAVYASSTTSADGYTGIFFGNVTAHSKRRYPFCQRQIPPAPSR